MVADQPVPITRMRKYIEGIEKNEYEVAAEQFSDDVLYRHPLGEEPIEGRADLIKFWKEREMEEGANETDHEFERWLVNESEDQFGVLGRVSGPKRDTIFVSYGEMDDGRISYYTPGLLRNIW